MDQAIRDHDVIFIVLYLKRGGVGIKTETEQDRLFDSQKNAKPIFPLFMDVLGAAEKTNESP